MGGPSDLAPRLRGQFLWSQFQGARRAGASMVYVAMFDEVDEGTAIFKCANDAPLGQKSKFLNFEGLPADFYLKLVGTGGRLIQGQLSLKAADSLASALRSDTLRDFPRTADNPPTRSNDTEN